MKIIIVGSGNTATVLGNKLFTAGHQIVQLFGRTAAAQALAEQWNASYIDDLKALGEADVYLITVSDTAIGPVSSDMGKVQGVVAHTSGAVPMHVLKSVSDHTGVFYPLQSLRKELPDVSGIPILIQGNTHHAVKQLQGLAETFSSRVSVADDQQRLNLHLAAVLVNNFSNHLYTLAGQYCTDHALDFKMLLPLIGETVHRLQFASPADVQTGPAIRNDQRTIELHLAMLEDYPRLKQIYQVFTESIHAYHRLR